MESDFRNCACYLRRCKWYKGLRGNGAFYCMAFPKGIPEEIVSGKERHKRVYPSQNREYIYRVGTDKFKVKPYKVHNMENPKLHGRDTLCSTIRDIFRKTEDGDIKLWCRIAMRMSKNMYKACQAYKDMLISLGVDVSHDTREEWQLTGRIKIKEK